MLPVYWITLLALSATYVLAIEHPRRQSRSRSHSSNIRVSVHPELIYFYPGESLKVRCKVKGGTTIEESPFISFYRQFDIPGSNAVMPLSSGSPGITIEASVPNRRYNGKQNRAVNNLNIGPDIFWTLQEGENMFYCKGSNMLGQSQTAYFRIIRVDAWNRSRRRRSRRLRKALRRAQRSS